MPRTFINTVQVRDGALGRTDFDISTPGEAMICMVIAGAGISLESTGVDAGTGDVIITNSAVFDPAPIKVHKTATQPVNSSTNTKMIFGGSSYIVTPASWLAASNRYIAQSTGIHAIKASVRTTGAARALKLMLYKNGALVQPLIDRNTVANNNPWASGSTDIYLASGDYIEIWLYASGNTTVAAGAECEFCARRVI